MPWNPGWLPAPNYRVWEQETVHITEMQVCQLAKGTAPIAQNQVKQKEINYETPLYKCDLRIQTISLSLWKER